MCANLYVLICPKNNFWIIPYWLGHVKYSNHFVSVETLEEMCMWGPLQKFSCHFDVEKIITVIDSSLFLVGWYFNKIYFSETTSPNNLLTSTNNVFEGLGFGFMVFNATFNNISVILWQSVLLVEETWVPGRKPLTCHKSLTNFIT